MTNRELIEALQKQKSLIGTKNFDEKLVEQYLNIQPNNDLTINNTNELKQTINIHGIESLKSINNILDKLEPFALENQNNFKKAKAPWVTLYTIARKTDEPIALSIKQNITKPCQKTLTLIDNHEQAA